MSILVLFLPYKPIKKARRRSPSFSLFPQSPAELADGLGLRDILSSMSGIHPKKNGSPAYFNSAFSILIK
jgi:hypothetical protein